LLSPLLSVAFRVTARTLQGIELRHSFVSLLNAGMSLQALMALLGHVTPQMTIRYATLASPRGLWRRLEGSGCR
jgi:site-specific recombinase XerD